MYLPFATKAKGDLPIIVTINFFSYVEYSFDNVKKRRRADEDSLIPARYNKPRIQGQGKSKNSLASSWCIEFCLLRLCFDLVNLFCNLIGYLTTPYLPPANFSPSLRLPMLWNQSNLIEKKERRAISSNRQH